MDLRLSFNEFYTITPEVLRFWNFLFQLKDPYSLGVSPLSILLLIDVLVF